ncbi:MAG: hypothetical protein ABIQ18_08535 [Umezawaea sp.]
MDPRDRADALLARARARGAHVVTPDNMTSPMDSSATQQIPRTMVNAVDPRTLDPESTMVISAQMVTGDRRPPQQQPPPPQQQYQQQPPPQQHYQQQQTEPVQRAGPGPVPTVQQSQGGRPSLTQRLNGDPPPPPGLAQRLNGDA